MKLNYHASSLIIVGGWNHSVIRPSWLDKHLIESVDSNGHDIKQVNIDIRIDETSSIKDSPVAISFDGISIVFLSNRLEFRLVETDDFSILEKYSLKMCSSLPNTPVTAYDVNFVFTDENICESIADIKNAAQPKNYDMPLTLEQYNFGFKLDDIDTTVRIDIDNNDNSSGLILNFSFSIDSLLEFKSGISKIPIHSLKEKAVKILSEMYGLKLKD